MSLVHHYTSINTLSLILKHRTIRFNRLDRVDDVSEADAYGDYKLGKFIYASCWTDSLTESIPLWHMYTANMRGIRISFEADWMNYQPIKVSPKHKLFPVGQGQSYSPIPLEQFWTDSYFILPSFLKKENLLKKVKYVDNPSDYLKNAVSLKNNPDGTVNLEISQVNDFATYKHKVWSFQEEVRFVLVILPAIPIPEDGVGSDDYTRDFPNHVIHSITNGNGPKLDYFDMEINPNVLNNINVTLGPLCDDSDATIVEALLEKHTTNGSIRNSSLSGRIRNAQK